MDGLSVGTSGIAVVSLAIQLVDSVRDIQHFLKRVSDAPKELRRLLELLGQLELILDGIGAMIQKQNIQSGHNDTLVTICLENALKTCTNDILMLKEIVDVAKGICTNNRAARTLGSLRLACKSRNIEEFEGRLQNALTLLNVAMTINLTSLQVRNTQMIVEEVKTCARNEGAIMRKTSTSSTASGANFSPLSNTRIEIACTMRSRISQQRITARYRSLIRTLAIHQKTERYYRHKQSPTKKMMWILQPWFLSRCIEIRYSKTLGTISFSLRSYPILPSSHPVFQMCIDGDITGLQSMFSSGNISPFSISAVEGQHIAGRTLLHYAVKYGQYDVCKTLLDLGIRADTSDQWGNTLLQSLPIQKPGHYTNEIFQTGINTVQLFASHSDSDDLAELQPGLFNLLCRYANDETHEEYISIVHDWVNKYNVRDFTFSPLYAAFRSLCHAKQMGEAVDTWKLIVKELVKGGADLHHIHTDSLLLVSICSFGPMHPFDSMWVGRTWLDILEESDVDVLCYLEAEADFHHASPGWNEYTRPYNLIISSHGGSPSIWFEWWTDESGHGYEVAEEFKNFGQSPWMQGNDTWPFIYPSQEEQSNKKYTRDEWQYVLELRKLASQRFERRQQKKVIKLAKQQGIWMKSRVPGAWID